MRNGFKQLNQFCEAVRRNPTLPAEVTMERWNELAERHSVVRAMSKQIHHITGKMLCSGHLLWCLICFQHKGNNVFFAILLQSPVLWCRWLCDKKGNQHVRTCCSNPILKVSPFGTWPKLHNSEKVACLNKKSSSSPSISCFTATAAAATATSTKLLLAVSA